MDKKGYKLTEIDEMDIGFYFELYSKEKEEKVVYADQVPWL
ncbi:hypothetical protein [Cytobacillus citreus]|nr:hypothetical protein [Cytobacillus citreus]